MIKSKWFGWLIVVCIIFITFVSSSWIIHPTAIALIQGDNWISVCRGVVELQINEAVVVQINDSPVSYLEKEDGVLEEYLEQKGYEVNEYHPVFMTCQYTNREGDSVKLVGHKCGSKYTIWKQQ